MKASDSLYEKPPEPQRPKRIDLAFERMIILCGVGCLIHDIAMDDNDYIRLHLAFSRLLGNAK